VRGIAAGDGGGVGGRGQQAGGLNL